jgi:hypothetical protein
LLARLHKPEFPFGPPADQNATPNRLGTQGPRFLGTGRVAQPFGFCPHRSVRAAFPHTALREGNPKRTRAASFTRWRCGGKATRLCVRTLALSRRFPSRPPIRVPLLLLEKPEKVFYLQPTPVALLVNLEVTLTESCPSRSLAIEAFLHFDEVATQNGLDLNRIHYITNADLKGLGTQFPEISGRLHLYAHKPFFTPPAEFRLHGYGTVVVGDQYVTDRLLAWRFGFSFGLVRASMHQPAWPRCNCPLVAPYHPCFSN